MGERLAKLPHLKRDVEKLFDYPQQFAEDIFNRISRRCANACRMARRTPLFKPFRPGASSFW